MPARWTVPGGAVHAAGRGRSDECRHQQPEDVTGCDSGAQRAGEEEEARPLRHGLWRSHTASMAKDGE